MYKRLILVFSILLLILLPVVSNQNVYAGNLTAMSDTLTRLATSTAANHLISFTMTAGTSVIENETITVTFASGFDISTIDCGDVDLTDDGADEDLQENAGSCTANSTEWGVGVSGQVLTLTAPSGAATYINGSSVVTIEIGTNATADEAGDEQITNPGSSGSKTISIGGTFGDTGSMAVPIMSGDQVTVSATVDPTITSSLSSSTCSLGTLTTGSVSGCTYTNSIITNATSGYVTQIQDDGNLRDGGNDINDVADGTVTAAAEEYGAASSDTSPSFADYDGTCGGGATEAGTGLTTSLQTYADATGPTSGDTITVCHSASIAGTTPAGSYQHIVTHITTGTF